MPLKPEKYSVCIYRPRYHFLIVCSSDSILLSLYTDIDECVEEQAGCEDTCINTFGSYYCLSPQGYILLENGTIAGDSTKKCAVIVQILAHCLHPFK